MLFNASTVITLLLGVLSLYFLLMAACFIGAVVVIDDSVLEENIGHPLDLASYGVLAWLAPRWRRWAPRWAQGSRATRPSVSRPTATTPTRTPMTTQGPAMTETGTTKTGTAKTGTADGRDDGDS